MNVPVVVLVAEGDLHTLDVVVEVLKKCIPVVILQGSGKAADLIAECMEDIESIEAKAPLLFGIYFCQEEFDQLKYCMLEIQERKHFVTIFDITKHDETEFSDVVVNSIIRGWAQGKKTENLEIMRPGRYSNIIRTPVYCRENNSGTNRNTKNGKSTKRNSIQPEAAVPLKLRVEEVKIFMKNYEKSLTPASLPLYFYIAYQFIQKTYFNENDLKEKNFQILLKQAIIANRVDYVAVLLEEENVDFRKEDFPKIYEVIECGCDGDGNCHHIKSILKGASAKATDILLGKWKEDGDKKKTESDEVIKAGRQLCQKFLHYPKSGRNKKKDEPETCEQDTKCIYQDLLIWSLFANRPQMATLFWMKCENQLLTAILARCVLRKMAEIVISGKDRFLFDAFTEHESVFEKRAIDLQTKLYEEDPEVAMELMLADQTVWDIQVTPLDCAFDNVMLDFIAHSCAQRRLNKIWYKGLGTGFGDFFKNGCLHGCKRQKVNEEEELVLFRFLYAPLTRFLVHYIIFLAVMGCYSAFLLVDLTECNNVNSIEKYEWLVYVWLLGDIYEEYRGIVPWNNEVMKSIFSHGKAHLSSRSTWYQLKRYINDFWNSLDVLFYYVTIAAIFVRFLSTNLKSARRLYSLSLFMMYMRFLHALLMSRSLGPKIIMIKEMLKDLFRFIGILFVFMMGVGVLYHANMYPAYHDFWSKEGWEHWRIWKIMSYPYWQIYGELFLDKFKGNINDTEENCTNVESKWISNANREECIQYDWVVTLISALYMLMSNLLLVNLVIALFRFNLAVLLPLWQNLLTFRSMIVFLFYSYRFEIVQNNSEKLWRYWRYAVIMDYRHRLPSPMNLMIRPLVLVYKGIKKHSKVKKSGIKKRLEQAKSNDVDEIKRMKRIQSISANKCIRQEL